MSCLLTLQPHSSTTILLIYIYIPRIALTGLTLCFPSSVITTVNLKLSCCCVKPDGDENHFPAICFANVQRIWSLHLLPMRCCLTEAAFNCQRCKTNLSAQHTKTLNPYIHQCEHTHRVHMLTPRVSLLLFFSSVDNLRLHFGNQ